jgi:hypothetical protein
LQDLLQPAKLHALPDLQAVKAYDLRSGETPLDQMSTEQLLLMRAVHEVIIKAYDYLNAHEVAAAVELKLTMLGYNADVTPMGE